MFSHERGSKERSGSSSLMYLILLLFAGFVIWAYFAKFDQVITAEEKFILFLGCKKSSTTKEVF